MGQITFKQVDITLLGQWQSAQDGYPHAFRIARVRFPLNIVKFKASFSIYNAMFIAYILYLTTCCIFYFLFYENVLSYNTLR